MIMNYPMGIANCEKLPESQEARRAVIYLSRCLTDAEARLNAHNAYVQDTNPQRWATVKGWMNRNIERFRWAIQKANSGVILDRVKVLMADVKNPATHPMPDHLYEGTDPRPRMLALLDALTELSTPQLVSLVDYKRQDVAARAREILQERHPTMMLNDLIAVVKVAGRK